MTQQQQQQQNVCFGAFGFLLPRKRTPILTLVIENDDEPEHDHSVLLQQQQQRTLDDNDIATATATTSTLSTGFCGDYYYCSSDRADDGASISTTESITCLGNNSSSSSSSSNNSRTSRTNSETEETTTTPNRRSSSWLSFPMLLPGVMTSSSLKETKSSSSSSSSSPSSMDYTADELLLSNDIATVESDLSVPQPAHPVWIVTTAALPWMTGTAVNPTLRAAYLTLRKQQQCNLVRQSSTCSHDDVRSGDDNVLNHCNDKSLDSSTTAREVHLVLPWLQSADDRLAVYGADWYDKDAAFQQAAYIQDWLCDQVPHYQRDSVQIHWYPARYHAALGSIFALGDICSRLPLDAASPTTSSEEKEGECAGTATHHKSPICILEEPEHLNYYRGGHWRTRFGHVIGIIHTNYCEYAKQQQSFLMSAPLVGAVSAWMVQAYCDKVIQLSATLPCYAPEKEVVCNVHGVRAEFFAVHKEHDTHDTDRNEPASSAASSSAAATTLEPQVYFLGKLLWAKGLDKLLELQYVWKQQTQSFFAMDIFGSGADQEDIERAFAGHDVPACKRLSLPTANAVNNNGSSLVRNCRSYSEMASLYWRSVLASDTAAVAEIVPLPVTFRGRMDHARIDEERSRPYKVFVNPSVSEVLCTVTAEAIAMGSKFVIIPHHPSNNFFEQFPNCLLYHSDTEFVSHLQYAVSNDPVPLSDSHRALLTWEGATERLVQAACISHREAARRDRLKVRDQRLADWHIKMGQGTTGDVLRHFLGGGPVARQSLYDDDTTTAGSSLAVPNLSRASSSSGGGDGSPIGANFSSWSALSIAI
jgi:digalactosyldiacylglycerol synthase